MPELVRCQPIRFSLMKQVRRELVLEHMAERISTESASCMTEKIVFSIVVGKRLCSLLLPPNRGDCAVTLSGGNTVIASRFCEPIFNRDAPVSLAILDQTATPTTGSGHLQVGQIFKAHPCSTQDQGVKLFCNRHD